MLEFKEGRHWLLEGWLDISTSAVLPFSLPRKHANSSLWYVEDFLCAEFRKRLAPRADPGSPFASVPLASVYNRIWANGDGCWRVTELWSASFALSKDSCCPFPKINKAFFFIMLISGWSSSVVAGKNDLKKFSKPGNSTLPPCSMEQDSPLCVLSMAWPCWCWQCGQGTRAPWALGRLMAKLTSFKQLKTSANAYCAPPRSLN